MQYKTQFYNVFSSLFFEKLEELRYKEVVKNYFTKVIGDDQTPMTNFEIHDALKELTKFMEDPGFLVFKIEGPYTVSVYRWDQGKPIITVNINIRNVDNINK